MAVNHYENFPVASLLLPRRLRKPVSDIYRFARTADDIADEGTATAEERLQQLAAYRTALNHIASQTAPKNQTASIAAVFEPLTQSIRQFGLPLQPFFDLLSAFEQDVSTDSYPDDIALFDYCRRSANPVGRLMLHLFGADTAQNRRLSDSICTGLQLTNFWQDVAIDCKKGRLYLPLDKLDKHKVTTAMIQSGQCGAAWQSLMQEQVQQARHCLQAGRQLPRRLGGRIGLETAVVIEGGLHILARIEQAGFDVFWQRPVIRPAEWPLLLWRALRHTLFIPVITSNTHP